MTIFKNKIFHFFLYGCFGIAAEVFFTAFRHLFLQFDEASVNFAMEGQSYVWMLPIYGSAAWLIPFFYGKIKSLPAILRPVVFVLGIWTVEFITGFLLEQLLGRCPWHYESKWAVMGYIKLSAFPFWFVFGFMLEKIHLLLNPEWSESHEAPLARPRLRREHAWLNLHKKQKTLRA